MTRSIWKGLFFDNEVIQSNKKTYLMRNRNNSLFPMHFHKLIQIYNGKQFIPIRFNKDGILGHKVGEFSYTKKKCKKIKKDKKNFKLKK